MTEDTLEKYAKAASERTGTASEMILELVDYAQRLLEYIEVSGGVRRPLPFGKHGEVTSEHAFPFGKHRGEPLCIVPDSYLSWWISQEENKREALVIDSQFAAPPKNIMARQKIRLYDYIQTRLKPQEPEPRSTEAETLPESAWQPDAGNGTVGKI